MATNNSEQPTSNSFDVFAQSASGYDVHFQISGDHVYRDALLLLERMAKDGFLQRPTSRAIAQAEAQATVHTPQPPASNGMWCPVHGEKKVKASQFNSGLYCAGRLPDGQFCDWRKDAA